MIIRISLISIGLAACVSIPFDWQKKETFIAGDGAYFPKFITSFFPRTQLFEKSYPTMAQARQGIKLIQVKKLVDNERFINESNLSWSENGRYLSYENTSLDKRSIFIRELSGEFQQSLTVQKKGRSNFLEGLLSSRIHSYNSGLTWSKSEQQYAFMSNGGVGEYNIYVGGVNDEPEVTAQSPSKDGYARWNPQRSELAFVSARSGKGDIYILDLDKNKMRPVSQSPFPDLFPEWLPSGKGLVYSSGNSTRHQITIVKRTNNGGWKKAQALTNWSSDNLRPKVSPDGKWIAFYGSTHGDRWNIYVIPISGYAVLDIDRPKYLVAEDVIIDLNTGPAWAPEGSQLFYVKRDPDRFNPIYAYNLRNGKSYYINTKTLMNRDLMVSSLGVLSFRAQVGAWDKVFVALTNLGTQIQGQRPLRRATFKNRKTVYLHERSSEGNTL